MLNCLDRRQEHVPHAELLREGLSQHHALSGLHRQGRKPLGETAKDQAAGATFNCWARSVGVSTSRRDIGIPPDWSIDNGGL